MHPFLDGNGRTARALEALMLQRAGLKGALFIAMSNYYYDEKASYLKALSDVRAQNHDLTPFLAFALRGIALQCGRLRDEIKTHLSKELFRNQMTYLFGRLRSAKKRVIAERHMVVLNLLLEGGEKELDEITQATLAHYSPLGNPRKILIRDLNYLLQLHALELRKEELEKSKKFYLSARLKWPEEITETEFFARVKAMPKAKTSSFLS
jgi:Fic family protein